jgi:uncharacterized protein (TIGR02145 family)
MKAVFCFHLLLFITNLAVCQGEISDAKLSNDPRFGFIENKGQIIDQNNKFNSLVLYLLNTPGMNVQLRRGGFSYDLYQEEKTKGIRKMSSDSFPEYFSQLHSLNTSIFRFHRIDLDLSGSNPDCDVITSGPSSDRLNYYTTGTTDHGITGVRSFQTVTYKDIYPGIDLEFISGQDQPFEYNFIVRPGANPDLIRIRISGPDKIRSSSDGIVFRTSLGKVEETIPLCYYKLNGISTPVEGKFRKMAEHTYGFITKQKIPEGAILVIDPIATRKWGTYYGGESGEGMEHKSLAVDMQGNIILGGLANSLTGIATTGAFQTTRGGGSDAFFVKFDGNGQRLWGTYFGGEEGDYIYAISTDQTGNIFVAGLTGSTIGISSPGAFQTVKHGGIDSFIAKFDPSGSRLWGTYYGGNEIMPPDGDWINACGTDQQGNIYCFGETSSPDFIATPGTHQQNLSGSRDAFMVKFTGDGNRVWGTYYGGSNMEQEVGGCVAKNGLLYISGTTASSNNIATGGSFLPNLGTSPKAFLACFDTSGVRSWGTYFGGENTDYSGGCVADTGSNVYFFGISFSATNIATAGAYQTVKIGSGNFNAYLEKFTSSGQRTWGTYFGAGDSKIYDVSVDDSGYVFLSGHASAQDTLLFSPDGYQTVFQGDLDAVLAKFSGNGQRIWSTYYGGTETEWGFACTTDSQDNIYLAGQTWSVNHSSDDGLCSRSPGYNYISTPGAYQRELKNTDVFLVKFSDCFSPDTAKQINGPLLLCQNSAGTVFSIPPIFSATQYHWCVSGNLTITAGQGTTSITVDVGPALGSDTISVYGINTCDAGFPKGIVRQVVANPVPVLSGPDTTCAGINNVFITTGGKTNYQWTISPGGAITLNGTSTDSSCTVKWSNAGVHWVKVGYVDTTGCASIIPTQFDVWVNPGLMTSVSISSSANPVCSGNSVTFTGSPVNEGSSPIYLWRVNGTDVGINNSSYTYTPVNGDIVLCQLTSSLTGCLSGNPATSNQIMMTVNPNLPVSITVTPSQNPVCSGTLVTFTANPTHGGSLPGYQWKVNAVNVINAINASYAYNAGNGDVVTCELTSSETCVTGNPALSPPVTMTVTPNPAVTISITPSANPFCPGNLVTFIAVPNHGGLFPAYLWKVNGSNVGANSSSFTYTPLTGDIVTCELTSSDNCVTGNPATSAPVTMTASPVLAVSVTIAASSNPFCAGSLVTFTSNAGNAGGSPGYQWKVNAINATNATNASYTYVPANGDQVSCILNSSASCITGNPALSNIITMTVNTNLPAGVSISTPTNPFCPGTAVTFNANPTNGGLSPSYQWKLNGVNAGSNSTTFTCNPAVGDSIWCVITSNLNCVTGNPASSGKIIMSGNPVPGVSFTACFDTVTILGAQPFILHGGLPPGGQYSGPGVNSITGTFTPSAAGTGLKTITYGYANVYTCLATKTKTILVQPNPSFTCGNNLTDIRDNKVYPTVQIGSQCWMASNLDFGFQISELTPQTDNCLNEKYSHSLLVIGNSFYQWDELMRYQTSPGSQGLCPPGWHVPTETEWGTLFNVYQGSGQAGKPLQDTLISGLKAQTNGVFYLNSSWSFNGFATLFWTSTPWNAVKAISHGMNVYDFSVSLYPASRANAFSVRCLRD